VIAAVAATDWRHRTDSSTDAGHLDKQRTVHFLTSVLAGCCCIPVAYYCGI